MTKLCEMIHEYCPNGVEYKSVGTVSKLIQPKKKIKSHDYIEEGKYPVIDQGQNYIGGYTNEEGAFPNDKYVIFGDHTCSVKYVDFPFLQGADGVKVLKANDEILPKYLYYAMCNVKMTSDYSRHWSKMKNVLIPIPHMEIQAEIVRILDNFTDVTNKLLDNLTAELNARARQFEYYRDRLFCFSDYDKSTKTNFSESVEEYSESREEVD